MRTRLVIIGMVLALASGCSSGTSPAANPPPPGGATTTTGTAQTDGLADPCSLLTGDEVDAATGRTFGDGAINTMVSQEFLQACDWQGPGVDVVQVLVTAADTYDGNKQSAADVTGSAEDVAIPGAASAYVVKGGYMIGMDMEGTFLQVSYISTDPDVADAVLTLATKAAGRMG